MIDYNIISDDELTDIVQENINHKLFSYNDILGWIFNSNSGKEIEEKLLYSFIIKYNEREEKENESQTLCL